jgi:flagellar biosynthesis component FlhA
MEDFKTEKKTIEYKNHNSEVLRVSEKNDKCFNINIVHEMYENSCKINPRVRQSFITVMTEWGQTFTLKGYDSIILDLNNIKEYLDGRVKNVKPFEKIKYFEIYSRGELKQNNSIPQRKKRPIK